MRILVTVECPQNQAGHQGGTEGSLKKGNERRPFRYPAHVSMARAACLPVHGQIHRTSERTHWLLFHIFQLVQDALYYKRLRKLIGKVLQF